MSWTDQDRLDKLFAFVWGEVSASSGDGDAVVVFKDANVQEVAAAFVNWESRHPTLSKWPHKRHDIGPEHVLFTDESNENLTFTSKAVAEGQSVPSWLDVKLEVW